VRCNSRDARCQGGVPKRVKKIILTTPCRLRGRSCFRSKVIDRNPCGLRFDPHVLVLPRCWSFQPWSFSRPIALTIVGFSASGPAALWSAQLAAFPVCRPSSLPLRGLFRLASFPFMVLPLSRPAASCSAQLTAISARKPSSQHEASPVWPLRGLPL